MLIISQQLGLSVVNEEDSALWIIFPLVLFAAMVGVLALLGKRAERDFGLAKAMAHAA